MLSLSFGVHDFFVVLLSHRIPFIRDLIASHIVSVSRIKRRLIYLGEIKLPHSRLLL